MLGSGGGCDGNGHIAPAGTNRTVGHNRLGKAHQLGDLTLHTVQCSGVGCIVDCLLGNLTFHDVELAIYITVQFQDLAVGIDVGVPQLDFGFQFSNACSLVCFVTVDIVLLCAGVATKQAAKATVIVQQTKRRASNRNSPLFPMVLTIS